MGLYYSHPRVGWTQSQSAWESVNEPPTQRLVALGWVYYSHPRVSWTQSQSARESVKEPAYPVGWTQPQSARW